MGTRNKNGGVTYKLSGKANLSKTLKIDTSKIKNSKKRTSALTKEYSSDRKSAKRAARETATSKTGITGGSAQAAKSYRAANPTTKKAAKKDTKKATKKTTKNKQLTSNEALLLQNLSRTGTKDVVKKGTKNAEKTLRTSKAKTDEYKNLDKKVAKKKSKPSKTLTSNESLLLQNLTRTGTPDVVNKGLKGAEKTLRTSKAKTGEYKDLNKKVAEQDEKFLNSSPFAYGVMAGSSPIPLKETLEKQTGQKIDTSKAEDTLGYKAGYMAGLMGEYAATGGIARGAVEKSIKSIAKAAGTKVGKEAVKKATEEATKQVAKNGSKLTELGKRVLTGAAADTITGVPTNALEAGKATSKAPDGEKGKTFAKSMAVNTAFDVGMGAGGEAVSAAMKAIRKRAAAKAASNAEPANTLKATESADTLKAAEQGKPTTPQTEANVKTPQTAETLSEGTIAQSVEKTPSNRKIKAQRTQPVKERLAAIREAREEVPEAPANASEVVKKAEQRKIQQVAEQKAGGDIEGARVMLTSAKEYIDGLKKTYEEERKKLVDYYEGYVREYKGKGVETYLVPADDSYYEFKARVNTSFNDNWYRDWYKVHHRPPAKKNARKIAEGIVDDIFRGESKDFPMEEMEELYKAIQSERDIYDSFAAEYNLTKEQRAELADIFDDEETKGIFIDADEYFEKNFPEFDALAKDLGADVNKNKPVYKESTAAVNEVRPEGEKVMYETETHARREQAAKDRLATDYDGEYKDLMAKEEYTSEDLATMGELLNREKTNFSRFHKLTRKAGEVSSRKGQELEAVKHIKENTAAGKVIKGEQASSRNVRNLEKENPRKLKQTKKQADETIEEVGKAVDTTVKETLQEVGKLAKATQGKAVKTETKALNTAIDETIADAVLATHSDAAVAKAVDEAIKQTDIKLKDVMGKSNKAKSEVKQQLVDTFSDNLRLYGVNDEGIEFFKETVEALFDSKLEKAAKQYLTQRFAFKDKTERKSMIEDVLELIRMGAYDDADIVALMRAKNGVNVLTPQQAKQVADYMDYYEAHPDTREGAEALAKANKIIANLEESTRGDKIRSVQRISMLFNPKTWFSRNMGGNVLLAGAENIKDIPAAAIDALVALKTGERTTQGVTRAKLKEQGKGVAKGMKEQLLDIRHNVNTARTNTKYEKPNKDVWNNKPMNTLDNLIGQLLQLGDRPFYEAAYGARKAELEALVKKGKSKLTAEEIEEEAKRVALDRVFQADTNLSQAANQLRDALNKVSGGFAGNLLFPFVQTPANILSKLLDYSPAGLLKAVGELSKTRKGTFNQKVFVDTLGRTFTGAGVITLGYALADKGLMSVDLYAQSGKEQQVQKAYEKQGLQSYAIQLEDGTSFTIDWANPIGSLLIMGAECYYGGANESDFVTSLFGGAQSAADSVLNQSFLQGLSTLFSSDGSISGGFGKAMLSATSQPLPSVIQALTRVVDPYKRETYDENPAKKQLNVLKSKIPGLSTTLPRKKDVTGEDVLQYQGRGTLSKVLEAYLYPANISERKLNNVNDEAVRVYEATGEQSALLRIGTKSFDYAKEKYTITDNEQFSRFQEVQGEYAYNELAELFSTKKYKNMTDDEKASAISKVTLEAKRKAEEDYLIRNKGYTQTELDFAKLSPSKQEGFANTSLTKEAYIDAVNTAKSYDADNNGSIKQAEFKEYVAKEGIKASTARELWIAYGWSPNTNPY